MKEKDLIDPKNLYFEINQGYKLLYELFTIAICKFVNLKENESKQGENMSITCLNKEIYENEEYYTFYWNHFQKGEKHFIELTKQENEYYFDLDSTTYNVITYDKFKEVDSFEKQYLHYVHLYYAYNWFKQLIK